MFKLVVGLGIGVGVLGVVSGTIVIVWFIIVWGIFSILFWVIWLEFLFWCILVVVIWKNNIFIF